MTDSQRVKVTHTFSQGTRDQVKSLVESGEIKDASTFIEEAVKAALYEQKMRHLALELEAFDDPVYAAEVARLGDEGMEDIANELNRG